MHSISGFRACYSQPAAPKSVRMREDVQHKAWGVLGCSYSPVVTCLVQRLPYLSTLPRELRNCRQDRWIHSHPLRTVFSFADSAVTCICTLTWHLWRLPSLQDSITRSFSLWSDRFRHQLVVWHWISKSCSKSSGSGVKSWVSLVAGYILSMHNNYQRGSVFRCEQKLSGSGAATLPKAKKKKRLPLFLS